MSMRNSCPTTYCSGVWNQLDMRSMQGGRWQLLGRHTQGWKYNRPGSAGKNNGRCICPAECRTAGISIYKSRKQRGAEASDCREYKLYRVPEFLHLVLLWFFVWSNYPQMGTTAWFQKYFIVPVKYKWSSLSYLPSSNRARVLSKSVGTFQERPDCGSIGRSTKGFFSGIELLHKQAYRD